MTLDQRLTQAMHHVADDVHVPAVDLAAVRSSARAHRVRNLSMAATAAVAAAVVAAAVMLQDAPDTSAKPGSTGAVTSDVQPSTPTTTAPQTFTSRQYDVTLQYPAGWTSLLAERAWSWTNDVRDPRSTAHDSFMSPRGDVRVSVWEAPIDPNTRRETTAYLLAWAEDYCRKSGNSPCSGIAERAVKLCLEPRDCHPGVLVPFKEDVQAFFSGGSYASDAMTVVAVWRPETDPSVKPYGGARKLLENFLETMDVRPNPTP